MAKTLHPDRGGNVEALDRLYEARAAALGRSTGADLVPLSEVTELVRAATGHLAEREHRRELQERSREVVQQVLRAHTSPVRDARRRVTFAAGVATLLALFGQALRAFTLPRLQQIS